MAKIQFLGRESAKPAQRLSKENRRFSIVKGHVNKILFVFPSGFDQYESVINSKLSVKHVSNRTTSQIRGIKMQFFKDITDEKFGSVIPTTQMFVALHNTIKSERQDSVPIQSFDDVDDIFNIYLNSANSANKPVAIVVDLGSFILDNGEEIHIDLERISETAVNTSLMAEVECYSVSDEPNESFHMLTYDTDKDTNELHQNVTEIYLREDNTDDFDIYVDSDTVQYQTTKSASIAWSMLTGRFENSQPVYSKIYQSDIPEDVAVKVIDADSSNLEVVTVRVRTDIVNYEKQQRNQFQILSKKIENLERKQSSTANVMIASGVVPSSSELELKASEFKS